MGPLHLFTSHSRFALASSLPFIHAKGANLIQSNENAKVEVTKVKFVIFHRGKSMVVRQKLEILSFFVFRQNSLKRSVL